jgi:hypothetical protein
MLYATASVCEGAVAVAVDLQRRERLDSLADALITHPEVPLRGDHAAVAHQLAQHLDRGAVVGVALGVAVAKRVGDHARPSNGSPSRSSSVGSASTQRRMIRLRPPGSIGLVPRGLR